MKLRVLALAVCVSLLALGAWAHGGEEHVTGTVSQVTPNSIIVKTTAGKMVTVGIAPESKFTRGKSVAQVADMKPGDRVVIHAKEATEGHLVADTVEFSTPAPKAATTTKPATKAPAASHTY